MDLISWFTPAVHLIAKPDNIARWDEVSSFSPTNGYQLIGDSLKPFMFVGECERESKMAICRCHTTVISVIQPQTSMPFENITMLRCNEYPDILCQAISFVIFSRPFMIAKLGYFLTDVPAQYCSFNFRH